MQFYRRSIEPEAAISTRELIELEDPRERAILVGAPRKSEPAQVTDEHLEELERLADTAGVEVVGSLVQRVDKPNPRTYIGEGKAEELKAQVAMEGATLVIFDDELSPAQGRNLEAEVGTRVMDRAELILDIFATRARSAEARAQVELAQLQYLRPRLTRMWAHLSRIRGGPGMRGPGETQLETDRRMVDIKIARLKGELERVTRHRETQRKSRAGETRVSLVGYTNAGKSSILRAISGADVFVEDRLFATLDPTTRDVDVGEGYDVLLTDTVGFIRKLPHHLVASFRATLEEAAEADLLLHVIDSAHPGWEEQKDVVDQVLAELGMREQPQILVFNKIDRLTHGEEEALRQRNHGRRAIFVSTVEEGALEPLRELLRDEARKRRPDVHLTLRSDQGALLAEIYREGEVLEREDEGAEIRIRARLPDSTLGRLRSRGVEVG
ncbi:GTPase HflX [Longimicrobium sp.]|uniref:GTPase HflX n=1 Tax=Longimicrobium sp. TaxID=2029185 RepID=UPI002CC8A046|nr:GTPase HflX [Longimicrobium sp.]HSU15239.1 GTPase HflX [Longimicrobium sp.]